MRAFLLIFLIAVYVINYLLRLEFVYEIHEIKLPILSILYYGIDKTKNLNLNKPK